MENAPLTNDEAETNLVENGGHAPTTTIEQLGALVISETTVLDEHQVEAFEDIVDFYKNGGREAYVALPTGTGKTVLYVELCRELLKSQENNPEKPRVMVLVPNIDLIIQTIGKKDPETGQAKGFAAFAPDLKVLPYYGSITDGGKRKALLEADVVVSTYNSFRNIVSGYEKAKLKSPDEWKEEQKNLQDESVREIANSKELIQERAVELRRLYTRQELLATRREAKVLLVGYDRIENKSAEDIKRVELLEGLVRLCATERYDDSEKMKKLRNMVSKSKTDRITRGVEYLQDVSLKVRQMAEVRRNAKEEGLNEEEIELKLREITTQSMENSMDFLDLDDYEKFLVRFIRDHRNTVVPINIGMLTNRDERDYIKEFNDQIEKSRGNATNAKSKIKVIDNYLMLLETGDKFNLIICDEAHRAIGTRTWDSIETYSAEKAVPVLGLTATDSYFERSLEDYFEKKAHDLPRQEAIKRRIINPVSIFVKETDLSFEGVTIDAITGDYDRKTMRQLAESEERNKIGIDYAMLLSEQGYHGIMSGIPGFEGAHAVYLAKLLNESMIIDPKTGQTRNLKARYVLGNTPKDLRQEYYEQFERGDLDWLTFIDVLREGWDSNTAKALINMRPTRSPLLATQRIGRIGRKDRSNNPQPSILIDLYDEISSFEDTGIIPPVTGADIYGIDDVKQGYIIGGNEEDAQHPAITALQQYIGNTITAKNTRYLEVTEDEDEPAAVESPKLIAHHNRYIEMLENSVVITQGGAASRSETKISGQWQTFEGLYKRYKGYISLQMIEAAIYADASSVRTTQGRQGYRLDTLYNTDDVDKLYSDKQEIDPLKLVIKPGSSKWITADGCIKLLSGKYQHIRADDITLAIDQLEEESGMSFDRDVAKVRINFLSNSTVRQTGFVYLYNLNDIIDRLVPYLG